MTYITEDAIKNIKDKNDIVDVISSYVPLTGKGKNFFGVCPFHDDHSPSMSVSKDKQIYKCFSCGSSGNVITFIQNIENISFIEALDLLAKRCGINISIKKENKVIDKYKDYYDIYKISSAFYKNNLNSSRGREANEYLTKRGLDKETIDYFDIGVAFDKGLTLSLTKKYNINILNELDLSINNNDSFINRIIFPIKNKDDFVVGYSARIYKPGDENSKYKNSKETPIFRKGEILYNYSTALGYIKKEHKIIICEGQMDVIRTHMTGLRHVVGLMGTSCTKEQLALIKNSYTEIILNLDQDSAGKLATFNIGNELTKDNLAVSVIIFDEFKDTDEFVVNKGKETFLNVYNNRVSFYDFKIDYLKQKYNLNNSNELSKYINDVIEILNEINDDILRDIKINELVKNYDINEEVIRSKLNISIKKAKNNPIVKNNVVTKKRYSKYDVSELRILYLMLYHYDVILTYESELGYLIDPEREKFAGEIIKYKNKNKTFDLSDFMSIITQSEEMNEMLKEIMSYNHTDEYNDEELDDYITTIKKYSVKITIDELKDKLKKSIDIEEKKKLMKKIENMKKEVLKW